MRIVVSAAAVSLTALLLGMAAAGVDVVPEAAGDHESYWVIEPHEQFVMGGGEEARTETVYINKTYWVRHPPPPLAYLDGCDRVPGYVYWWHSNATHRLADPGYAPFMEYGVHYANASKVMPDLQKRIDAAGGGGGEELCVTAVLAVSGAPGGLVYAGEDVHGGANATLHAVAGFLRDRGAVLEDYWDWDYGLAYPPVDPGLRGGPYPGSEYPDTGFVHNRFEFVQHQMKQQISARVTPALVDELAARPDVVALDVYGKWVGTPEFMLFNPPMVLSLLTDRLERGVDPIPVDINIRDAGNRNEGILVCPHMCFDELAAVEESDGYYDGVLDRHLAWTAAFIEEREGNVRMISNPEVLKSGWITADVSPSLVMDLAKLRIIHYINLEVLPEPAVGMIRLPMTDGAGAGLIEAGPVGKTGQPGHPHGGARAADPGPAAPDPEETRCESGRIPFERPARSDTVCVYPGTAERLGARGPW